MRNIIKEISDLESYRKSLEPNYENENKLFDCDCQINELTLQISESLTIPMYKLGPHLAEIESQVEKKLYIYKEIVKDKCIKYYLHSSDNDIELATKKIKEKNHQVLVYSISFKPSMLTLELKVLNKYPELKECIDEYITFHSERKTTEETKDTVNAFFERYNKEQTELKGLVKEKSKK